MRVGSIHVFLFRALAAIAVAWSVTASASAQAPRSRELFVPAQASPRVPAPRERFAGVMHQRTVRLDVAALRALGRGDAIRLNLFEHFDVVADVSDRRATRFGADQWVGALRNVPGSRVLLTEVDGAVSGLISAPGIDSIRIFSAGPGRFQVVQLDSERQPACGVDEALPAAPRDLLRAAEPLGGELQDCDTGLIIDLMMVYTASARDAAGGIPNSGPAAILAEISLAELDFNTILQNSEITPRVRVVHTHELLDPEGSTFSSMLSQLTSPSDGVYDEVHSLRDSVGADVVCMLIANSSLGGIAWLLPEPDPSYEAYAFNVNNWSRAADSVVAHEVGHNMGCCHDRDNCSGGVFPYSWGHRFIGDDDVLYRTVMSYSPGAWIKYFSNPDVLFAGQPTGETVTDNARTIDETAPIVANYRVAPAPLTPPATVGTSMVLTASDAGLDANMRFGIAVDIEGPVAVIGALDANGLTAPDTGAAYVFQFDGLQWVEEAKLLADDEQTGDSFGAAVSISGDAIAVGAFQADPNGTDSGAVYIFRYDDVTGLWLQEQKLTPDPEDGFGGGSGLDYFGASVALSGDRLLVGAYRDDDTVPDSGSAYVFEYTGSQWLQTAKLHASDPNLSDNFGVSVSLDGDLAVIGAWMDDELALNAGAAYVFRFNGLTWAEEVKLVPSDMMPESFVYGVSVGISGNSVVVGSRGDDKNSMNVGSAFTYRYDGMFWVEEVKLSSSDDDGQYAPPNSGFGAAVSISGDEVAVGALLDDVTTDGNEGAVYPFTFFGGQWRASPRVIANDAMPGDNFGKSVANEGGNIITGAWLRNGGRGAAYVFAADAFFVDCNANGILDSCDVFEGFSPDCNLNGVPDECDVDPVDGTSPDCNGNGVPDACDITSGFDTDCNENAIPDQCDLLSGVLVDSNGDGTPDACQDCDGDGLFDPDEIAADPSLDCNLNGVLDECDIADGTSADVDLDGIPDECGDCDGNGVPDFQDLAGGAPDINNNNVLDVCEPDCNGNGLPDDYDIETGTSFDFNDDGVPDECEPDCDGDGVPDSLQIIQGTHVDCNLNAVPDFCDIRDAMSGDCDNNAIPDECQLADGSSVDINLDGIPDECQDCNFNGVFDNEEIAVSPVLDCNLNLQLDSCESPDLNGNGLPDFCEDCNGNLVPDWLDLSSGTSLDQDLNNVPDECERVGDTDDDGVVDINDLLTLLSNWGFCQVPCPGDVNFDGVVDINDLLIVLGDWG